MKLDQLRHVVAIVEHGGLRAAARRLGVPQPALTRSVRALEAGLGATLFVREPGGMVLTARGRLFHARACAIVNEARLAADELSQAVGEDEGTVSVALSIMPLVGLLGGSLAPFRARYPKVRLQLSERLFPDAERALRRGDLDFYLGAAPREAPGPGLSMARLFANVRSVVCRPSHPLGGARSLRALADAEWATAAVDYDAEQDLERVFAAKGLPAPRIGVRAHSAMALMVTIAHSDLLAMLPVQWQESALTRGTLRVVPVRDRLPGPDIVLIRRPGLPLTPAAEFFADVLMRGAPRGRAHSLAPADAAPGAGSGRPA